ncbi:putative RNA-directed DNA polymerase [Tanacetum coccineum]
MTTKRKLVPKCTVNAEPQSFNGNIGLQNFNEDGGIQSPGDGDNGLINLNADAGDSKRQCIRQPDTVVHGESVLQIAQPSNATRNRNEEHTSIHGVVHPDNRPASSGPPSGYRTACEKLADTHVPNFKVRLYNVVGSREYKLPTGDMLGDPRYMYSNYLDALAICRVHDRADIVDRVFEMKIHQFIKYLGDTQPFGKTVAVLYTIEFQERGLPHCHTLLWIHEATRVRKDEDIDMYVSAELPSIDADPECTTSRDLWLSLKKAYAHHSTSREYTLKTQLLRIEMHCDETPDAYLNCAQEYADALAAIGEPVKDKDLVMLVVSGLREEYNGLKTTITARQSPTAFSELHVLLSDHDYMLGKTRAPAPFITSSFAANYAVGSPSMPEAISPITPSGPQAFYGARLNNNNRSNNNNNCGNHNNSHGNNNRGRGYGRQFDWASNHNTIYDAYNRCGIGHIPSQCPNSDPSTICTRLSVNFANTRAQSSNASTNWHSDTGINSHVTPDLAAMDTSEAYYGDDAIHVGNGKGLPILHIGLSKVYSPQKTFSLKNILYVLEISHNLLYVQKLCHDNDVFFEFHNSYFVVKDESTHTTLLTEPSKHGLYTITLPQLKSINKVSFSAVRASPTIWHRRLGHPHQRLLRSMLSNFSLPVTNKSLSSFCNSCPLGKSSKLPLFESGFQSNNILDLVYCDVWGPAPLLSFEGHRYFMLCVDHHSRYMWIYHLAQKSDVYSTFKSFVQMVERQFTTKLKNVQTDWGGEFRNLASFFSSLGIIHRRSCPHTSEQNGFVERRNRHVVETGLTLLAQACVPQRFWHYAFDTAVYLINCMPSRTSTNKSPFEHICKRSLLTYSFLRWSLGCLCFPHFRPYNRHKMDLCSTPCVFLGYSPSHYGYRFLDISTKRLYIAQHVRFNEAQFPFDIPKTTSPPPSKTSPYYSSESPYVIPTNGHPSPSSPRSPISSPSSVSHLSPTSQTSQTSPGLKRDKNGAIIRYKARFIAKGFWQQPGIDFHETFSPIVKSTTIRAVLSLAVTNDWPLRQLDIQNAFLHGNSYGTGNNKGTIDNIICQLGSAFALKDLGPLNYFLGIEIVPHVSGILLSQKKYILELLQSAGLSNCNPVSSPMVTSSSLNLDDSTAFSNPVCQNIMPAASRIHWSGVKRILRYLHGTVEHGMLIRRSSGSTLQAFTHVVWKGNPDTFLKAFSDADWLEIQMIDEAEYKAIADTVAKLTWLQALLHELGIHSSLTPILWCDNLGATYLSANPIFRARTKHVEIDYHFVWEKVAQGDLRVQHISTHDQIAYIFTKPLPTPRFLFLRSKLQWNTDGRHLTYLNFPSQFVWNTDGKYWSRRCKSFPDIRTVDNTVCATCRAACQALGIQEDDQEWETTLQEAACTATPDELRTLFAHILAFCQVSNPVRLWKRVWKRKTFLWKTIIYALRAEGKIVLEVASSGVASLLLPAGRTARSRFKLPLDLSDTSVCSIKKNTHLATLIKETSLIVWDESPMNDCRCFETLDRTLRDILDMPDTLFGGKTVMLGGDFRQTLPVKKQASRDELIDKQKVAAFASWLLDIGNGHVGTPDENDPENTSWVDIPISYRIPDDSNGMMNLIKFIYDDQMLQNPTPQALQEKIIVCPKNEVVDIINAKVMSMLPGRTQVYISYDGALPHSHDGGEVELLYPKEYLNTLSFAGLPPHRLELKVGTPIILLRNISIAAPPPQHPTLPLPATLAQPLTETTEPLPTLPLSEAPTQNPTDLLPTTPQPLLIETNPTLLLPEAPPQNLTDFASTAPEPLPIQTNVPTSPALSTTVSNEPEVIETEIEKPNSPKTTPPGNQSPVETKKELKRKSPPQSSARRSLFTGHQEITPSELTKKTKYEDTKADP